MAEIFIPTPLFEVGQRVRVRDYEPGVMIVTGVRFDPKRRCLDYTLHDDQELESGWGGTDGFDEDALLVAL